MNGSGEDNNLRVERPEWSSIGIRQTKGESKKRTVGDRVESSKRRIRKNMEYRSSEGRLVNTREYAIAWGVLNRPYSLDELRRKCHDDPDAPSFQYIVKVGWQGYTRYYGALLKAGMEPRPPRTDNERRRALAKISHDGFRMALLEADYDIAKLAAEYGVATQEDYRRVRREHPELRAALPSERVVVNRFGTWRHFSQEVMKYNVDAAMTAYVRESAERGRWLTPGECDGRKIPIRKVMDILRPRIFNAVCYRKLEALGYDRLPSSGEER